MMVPAAIVLSLAHSLSVDVAQTVSHLLGWEFVDVDKQIHGFLVKSLEYNDPNRQFYQTAESYILKTALNKKRAVICVSFDVFRHNQNLFNGKKVFFLHTGKQNFAQQSVVDQIAFKDRNKFLENCTEKIECNGMAKTDIAAKIIKKIRTKL